jgi:anti-repressor protein
MEKKSIQIFSNPQFGEIRTLADEANEPLFCLADLCAALGISNHRNVKARLDEEDVRLMDTPTNGGLQQITFVTESGMYDVILRSDAEKAKPFRKWVTSEVLPAIRKHGVYATPQTIDNLLAEPDNAIKVFQTLKEERQLRQIAEAKIEADAHKVLFAESLKAANRSILIGELAKILKQNGYETGQKRLFQYLRDNGYLMKSGSEKNQPTQKSMEMGLFEITVRTVAAPDGLTIAKATTKVTCKGQEYFINKLTKGGLS